MKRIALMTAFICIFAADALAWGCLGHEVVIAVAQRHLTEKTKKNIAKFIDYDLKKDAVWMDEHRHDEPIAYSTTWHTSYFDKDFNYTPNVTRKIATGDVFRALTLAEATFRNNGYKRHCDSVVVFHLRSLIHFVGDMHCPSHTYYDGLSAKWGEVGLNGKTYCSFHVVYDAMPSLIWGKMSADEIAAQIDNASKREIKKIVSGDLYEWLSKAARMNRVIYDWNPDCPAVLRDDTVNLSVDLVNTQMRNAGYQLAYLLNLYFGD